MRGTRRRATIVTSLLVFIALHTFTHADSKALQTSESVQLTGEYQLAIAETFDGQPPTYLHSVKIGTQFLELKDLENTNDLNTGDTISVTGRSDGQTLVVDSLSKLDSSRHNTRSTQTATRNIAVFFLNFSDVDLAPNAISDTVESMYTAQYYPISVDGSQTTPSAAHVNESLHLSSFGQTAIDGDANGDGAVDTFGPYDLSLPSTSCGLHQAWANAADLYAELEGADLSIYQHKVYIVPHHLCGWNGLGVVGCGDNCRLWSRTQWTQTLAHELGHNFGLWHAAKDVDGDGELSDLDQVADTGVMMASGNFQLSGHLVHAPHRYALGWFDNLPGALLNVNATGAYSLNDLQDTVGAHPQSLRLNLNTGTGTRDLFVAYRRGDLDQYGLVNSYFSPVADIADSIRVHECLDASCTRSLLRATLHKGEHYLDHSDDPDSFPLLISATHASGDTATVEVFYGDTDADGTEDYEDNCSVVANPSQTDTDCDGIGNRCDGDFNNDGNVNVVDLGVLRSHFFTSDELTDLNSDGVVNSIDLGIFGTLMFETPGPSGPMSACSS